MYFSTFNIRTNFNTRNYFNSNFVTNDHRFDHSDRLFLRRKNTAQLRQDQSATNRRTQRNIHPAPADRDRVVALQPDSALESVHIDRLSICCRRFTWFFLESNLYTFSCVVGWNQRHESLCFPDFHACRYRSMVVWLCDWATPYVQTLVGGPVHDLRRGGFVMAGRLVWPAIGYRLVPVVFCGAHSYAPETHFSLDRCY